MITTSFFVVGGLIERALVYLNRDELKEALKSAEFLDYLSNRMLSLTFSIVLFYLLRIGYRHYRKQNLTLLIVDYIM